ncbi:hypothetical protein B0H17DRAFT_1205958 [Mycena rosella]|uniref:DUF6533 domain-containing protein n=1 Tax=Mycena rosella TaxID=1033263 RepID=A0AAD7GDG0_MYCRO|nr:hypothetical protein B0H17DRAFT_1205958 [Mycena rosella]
MFINFIYTAMLMLTILALGGWDREPFPFPAEGPILMVGSYASLPRGSIPGFYQAMPNPLADANSQLSLSITSSIAFALVVWEYAVLFPEEIELYRKPVWGTVPPYAFLALRYGAILATLPTLLITVVPTSNCQAAASISQVGNIVVLTCSAIIFTFRTSLLWPKSRLISLVLGALLVATTTCCIVVATQYQAIFVPGPSFASNCSVLPTPPWYPLGPAVSAAFFITALVLTLLKMQYHHPRDSRVAARVYRANLAYLIGTTLTAVTVLVVQSLAPPSSPLALGSASLATVLIFAFAARAFRNLTLATVLDADRTQAHLLPYPSTSPIISPASEIRFAHPPPLVRAPSSTRGVQSSRPHTAESVDTAQKSPYTTFPSPPSSYTSQSPLNFSSSPPARFPGPLLPLRRGALQPVPEPLRSGWSDS